MLALCQALTQIPEIEKLFPLVAQGGLPAAVSGLSHAHKAHVIASIHRLTGKSVLVITPDESECVRLAADMASLAQEEVLQLPAREFNFHQIEASSHEWEHARLSALAQIQQGHGRLCCATVDALLQRTLPPSALANAACHIKIGQILKQDDLLKLLHAAGYVRVHAVEATAQFSQRGGIVDFFPPGAAHPYRLEFFGDEVDTLFTFHPDTQRRLTPVQTATVLPVAEFAPAQAVDGLEGVLSRLAALIQGTKKNETLVGHLETDRERLQQNGTLPSFDRYMSLVHPTFATALDYFDSDTIIVLSEQSRLLQRIENCYWQYGQDVESLLTGGFLHSSQTQWLIEEVAFWHMLTERQTLQLDAFTPSSHKIRPRAMFSLTAKQLPSYGGSLDTALEDIAHYQGMGFATVVLCPDAERTQRLLDILKDRDHAAYAGDILSNLPTSGQICLAPGQLSAGMEYPSLRLAIISEGQFVASAQRKREKPVKRDSRARIHSYADLKPGDLVVHDHHGIGRFVGVVPMETDGVKRDYVKLSYAGTDVLYVPVTKLNLVSKYIGAGEDAPAKLNKLHTAEWARTKVRAKAAAKDLAKGLIALYAERTRRPGFAFPKDDAWQSGFEDAFPYTETDDQLRCTAEIKVDMERQFPMDRLLCGDVGFGKTEVALRAVMKCVLGGKQAAILVPTTVLAQQHYVTAVRRFDHYPVRVDVLSRFRTPKQVKESLKRLQSGALDLIIGTHRLLQKDVQFKELGLLVIDEEQRFGVTHKERLKEIAKQVDVLTLTATPIPRTLNMALSGIRDMSTIEEAPRDRSPVQTFVLEHNWEILMDAIRREVSRGGQVYYLYNRVESIERVVANIRASLPDVQVAAAHGKMTEEALSEVMREMTEGELHVLVCTTIIETGIDIPNVNTLIVTDADRLGLSQLHQIRGRVGRSPRHAYAYLTYKQGKVLTEIATKRLSAIREFAEFGSGFKIAMRDLEIRGAGNVLGSEQSGQMLSVGYDMYLRLLEEAVLEERGEAVPHTADCTVELTIAAGIPEGYIASSGLRMDFYRRIAAIRDEEDASDLLEELIDRFGDVPRQVDSLVQVALLRASAGALGVLELAQKAGRLILKLEKPDFACISALCALPAYKGRILFSAGSDPALTVRLPSGANALKEAKAFVLHMQQCQTVGSTPPQA